jgi:hypothetical protein
MGYYISIEESDFIIPKEHLDEAYKRMCELNVTHDDKKTGGSWTKGQEPVKWFAWMDENYPETCKDTFEILIDLGFEIENPDGDINIVGYDSKMGQENLFLECVSEFVVSSTNGLKPYIIWRGEDSSTWKEVYGDKEVRVYDGTIVYLGEEDEH